MKIVELPNLRVKKIYMKVRKNDAVYPLPYEGIPQPWKIFNRKGSPE